MKKSAIFLLFAAMAIGSIAAVRAEAKEAMVESKQPKIAISKQAEDKPLLIIRFNRPGVHYQPALEKVVEKVQSINDAATFKVISFIPPATTKDGQQANKELATHNGKRIVSALQELGVPAQKIALSYQKAENVTVNEVHIAVN